MIILSNYFCPDCVLNLQSNFMCASLSNLLTIIFTVCTTLDHIQWLISINQTMLLTVYIDNLKHQIKSNGIMQTIIDKTNFKRFSKITKAVFLENSSNTLRNFLLFKLRMLKGYSFKSSIPRASTNGFKRMFSVLNYTQ